MRSLAVAAFLCGASLFAQTFDEAVQVNIVEVPVTVVDRDGRSVRTLTKENFELYDEGRRVDIEYFEMVDIAAISGQGPTTRPLPPVASRNFLLLFDLENSAPGTIARAQEAAKQFIDSGPGTRDVISVATYSDIRGIQLLTSFTTDRDLVRTAVEAVRNPQRFRISDPLMLSTEVGAAIPRRAADVGVAIAEANRDANVATQKASDAELRNRLRVQLTNFGRVAQTLNRLHGQKQVILLSEGFDARLVYGREDMNGAQSKEEIDQIFRGQGYRVDTDQRFGNTGSARDLTDMARLYRRADVVLHAIDIAGLRTNVDAKDGLRQRSNESLSLLTSSTGGTVFKNVNDLSENFWRMLRQQEMVYLLGFRASSTRSPGKFHNLRVKTVNTKTVRVSHRAGYFEPSPEIADLEKTLTLAEIVVNDLPIDDVAVSISATAMPGPDGKARVPVVVELPGKRLLAGLASPTATATLFLYAFDDKGRVYDHLEQRIALDVKNAGDAVRDAGIRYYGTLRVPAGHYALKALVRVEESGRIGFARNDIQVPAFDSAVVLPPLLFAAPEKWLMLTGPARGDDFPYPFAAGDAKYVPLSHPELSSNGEYKLALFLYRIPLEGLDLAPVIASADGATTQTANVTLLGRTTADERGGTKLLLSFRTDNLQTGDYELQLTVTPRDGGASMVRMPFVLR